MVPSSAKPSVGIFSKLSLSFVMALTQRKVSSIPLQLRAYEGRTSGFIPVNAVFNHAFPTRSASSDVRQKIEVFIVFVRSSLALAKFFFGFDELDPLNPLDHLVSQLVFDPQPQRSAMLAGQRIAVHPVGEDALRFQYVLQVLRIVVRLPVRVFTEREEGDSPGRRFRLDELD